MRIAFILPSLENRGPNVFTQYLIKGLLDKVDYIEVFYFKEKYGLTFPVKCSKIDFWKKADFSSFDIVHSTMAVPDIYSSLRIPKNKWVVAMHNYVKEDVAMSHSKWRTLLINFLWIAALRKNKNCIVSSRPMLEYYKKLIGENIRYSIIPYGISEKDYSNLQIEDINKINEFKAKGLTIVGSVGLLIKRKGFDQLIKLASIRKDIAVIIIGEGDYRQELEQEIVKYNVRDRVYVPGFRDNSVNFYQYFDAYGHVSYSEGFGLAMLEAMSKGVPIICSKLKIYDEYFTDNDVCYFTPDDIKSLENAFEKCINQKEHYSVASRKLFLNRFSLEKMAESHVEFYKNVLNLSE